MSRYQNSRITVLTRCQRCSLYAIHSTKAACTWSKLFVAQQKSMNAATLTQELPRPIWLHRHQPGAELFRGLGSDTELRMSGRPWGKDYTLSRPPCPCTMYALAAGVQSISVLHLLVSLQVLDKSSLNASLTRLTLKGPGFWTPNPTGLAPILRPPRPDSDKGHACFVLACVV